MNGRDFWNVFVGAGIPASELTALGNDIGYLNDVPSSGGSSALLKLAYTMGQHGAKTTSAYLFQSLKSEMPGILSRKSLLYGLADDYDANKTYEQIGQATREYINAVAKRMPDVTKPTGSPEVSLKRSVTTIEPTTPPPGPPPRKMQAPVTASSSQSAAPSAPAQAPAPKGLTQKEWDFLRAVVGKLAAGQGDQITANNLASARNLAERANLAIVQSLDAEIDNRGEGAQDPDSAPSSPSSANPPPTRAGLGALGILGLAIFAFIAMRG